MDAGKNWPGDLGLSLLFCRIVSLQENVLLPIPRAFMYHPQVRHTEVLSSDPGSPASHWNPHYSTVIAWALPAVGRECGLPHRVALSSIGYVRSHLLTKPKSDHFLLLPMERNHVYGISWTHRSHHPIYRSVSILLKMG